MSLFGREKRVYAGGPVSGVSSSDGYSSLVIPLNSAQPFGQYGYPMNSQIALRHWAVWACVRIIADVVSTLPQDVIVNGTPLDATPTKIMTPSAYATSLQWRWQVMTSVLLTGNAYGMIASTDRLGYPSQVDLLAPEQVTVKLVGGKKKFVIRGEQASRELGTDEVWHLPGPQLPGDLVGMSPITYAARTIGLGLDAQKFGSDYLRNGIHPSGVASSDQQIDEPTAKVIKDRAKKAASNRDLLVMGAGLDLKPWQITAEESQFLETLRNNAVDTAQIFGVPPEMIGAASRGQSITYANREQRAQDFLNNAVNPWLARLEEAQSAWFPRGTFVKFNTGGLLRSDLATRFAGYEIGIQNGFMERSEARAFENWTPIPGLDDRPLPAGRVPVTPPKDPTTSVPKQ